MGTAPRDSKHHQHKTTYHPDAHENPGEAAVAIDSKAPESKVPTQRRTFG